ncbi:hypothetical protein OA92_06620 [Marinomonas sp. SBI22]|uniref:substrate-binding periplasmic protein n=1 Tax=unclassified Marinomonas TaxID=196814 RepID=UPI0007AEF296|nr:MULTISPECIES: hypothetical protein [unclassified Marinomonas]KZM44337.1 hypothetical protein OA92_06620 [Marinomonas sp. SBI22]KZM45495.1 hypothetical protein OA91_07765 [Marinomonas sp. SBI8L]
MQKIKLILSFCLLICPFLHAEVLSLTHIRPHDENDVRNAYFIDVLKLALSKTEERYGRFELNKADIEMNQLRALKNLENKNNIDVVWTMTSIEREELLEPIRIPLLKGLLGYRVFIIRKGTQPSFSAVESLSQLKALSAGQGADWPDTSILKANGLTVVEASGYSILFSMLERERFDYFPRGVNEPWAEVSAHADKGLEVEKTLILQYPAPIYFFVNKDNQALAERIELGLRRAIEDGSFDIIFRNHPANKEIFNLAEIEKRRIFKLANPFLPEKTPINDESLWYQGN